MKDKGLLFPAGRGVSGQWEYALLSRSLCTSNFVGRSFPGISCHGRGPTSHLSLASPCRVHVCECPCGWLDLSSSHKMDEMLNYGHYLINAAASVPRGTEGTSGS